MMLYASMDEKATKTIQRMKKKAEEATFVAFGPPSSPPATLGCRRRSRMKMATYEIQL
jgi:hypothetical protein